MHFEAGSGLPRLSVFMNNINGLWLRLVSPGTRRDCPKHCQTTDQSIEPMQIWAARRGYGVSPYSDHVQQGGSLSRSARVCGAPPLSLSLLPRVLSARYSGELGRASMQSRSLITVYTATNIEAGSEGWETGKGVQLHGWVSSSSSSSSSSGGGSSTAGTPTILIYNIPKYGLAGTT